MSTESGSEIRPRRPDPGHDAPPFDPQHSGAVYRALLEGMLDPVVFIDPQGIILGASDSTVRVFGYTPEELRGTNISRLMTEPYRGEHDGYLRHYFETGKTKILGRLREFQVVRKDGEVIDIELSVNRIDLPGHEEPLFIGSFRDSTDRNRARLAESSMLRALAAVGESAAMLAHEIKNPITAVNLALRAVARELGEDQQDVLQDLVARMKRLEQQLRQTLSFVRPLELSPMLLDARTVFDGVVRSLAPISKRARVEIQIDVDAEAPTFRADLSRLEEALVNLTMNAIEMLEPGGHVRLAAGAESNGRLQLIARTVEGRTVELSVEDDGPGIAAGVRESLFKPYVTTKAQGTGLGLAICRRIVEEHGGSLEAGDSAALGGARFTIRLPAEATP